MSKYFMCRCEEHNKPLDERNWLITKHMWNDGAFIKRPGRSSRWSTVECMSCGAVGRTKGNYVYRLKLLDTGGLEYKRMSSVKVRVPLFVRFLAVNANGDIIGFESKPHISEVTNCWVSDNREFEVGLTPPPTNHTECLYLYDRG